MNDRPEPVPLGLQEVALKALGNSCRGIDSSLDQLRTNPKAGPIDAILTTFGERRRLDCTRVQHRRRLEFKMRE